MQDSQDGLWNWIHEAGKFHLNADALSRAIADISAVPLFGQESTLATKKLDPFSIEIMKNIKDIQTNDYMIDIDSLI